MKDSFVIGRSLDIEILCERFLFKGWDFAQKHETKDSVQIDAILFGFAKPYGGGLWRAIAFGAPKHLAECDTQLFALARQII